MKHYTLAIFFLVALIRPLAAETVFTCTFERLPVATFTIRGGMGAADNTVQFGSHRPISLSVGSSLMTANNGAQEFVFSLRLPSSVTVTNQGSGGTSTTYYGDCREPSG
jgi:hypothetical protein